MDLTVSDDPVARVCLAYPGCAFLQLKRFVTCYEIFRISLMERETIIQACCGFRKTLVRDFLKVP